MHNRLSVLLVAAAALGFLVACNEAPSKSPDSGKYCPTAANPKALCPLQAPRG